jgi:hypothetical protein
MCLHLRKCAQPDGQQSCAAQRHHGERMSNSRGRHVALRRTALVPAWSKVRKNICERQTLRALGNDSPTECQHVGHSATTGNDVRDYQSMVSDRTHWQPEMLERRFYSP